MNLNQQSYELGVDIYSVYGDVTESLLQRAKDLLENTTLEGLIADEWLKSDLGENILDIYKYDAFLKTIGIDELDSYREEAIDNVIRDALDSSNIIDRQVAEALARERGITPEDGTNDGTEDGSSGTEGGGAGDGGAGAGDGGGGAGDGGGGAGDGGGGAGGAGDGGGGGAHGGGIVSPLVLDLDGDGVELSSLSGSNTYFDLNIDGFAERTGWVTGGDGLLALDLNGNGRIDDNSELFGNATGFDNGFLALFEHDDNADGVIDQSDSTFLSLRVWVDANQDGRSSTNELFSLSDLAIASINISATEVNETNQGHLVSHRSSFTYTNGQAGIIEDIHFRTDPSAAYRLLADDFEYHPEAKVLPTLWGYGQISSTWVAYSESEALRTSAKNLVSLVSSGNITQFMQDFEGFMLQWAGVSAVDPASRGTYIDGRHMAFLDKVYGTTYVQLSGTNAGTNNPGPSAAAALEETYSIFVEQLAARFMVQAVAAAGRLGVETLDELTLSITGHPLGALVTLMEGYSPQDRAMDSNLASVLKGLDRDISAGKLDSGTAVNVLHMLRHDLAMSGTSYETRVVEGLVSAGIDLSSAFGAQLMENINFTALISGAADDTILASAARQVLFGGAGSDTMTGHSEGSIFVGGTGHDSLVGGTKADTYFYSAGDGNDTIRDHSYSSSTNDRLVLQGLAAGDVSFAQNAGKDLVITLANGETVTITDHFDGSNYDMELIEFSDGTVLNAQGIRDKTVADMKAPGATVLGSEFAETYVHAMGDGSYTIRDYSVRSGVVDQLIFADALSAEAVIQRRASDPNDVVISFANGDHILLDDEVRSNKYYGVETILFADGVSLSRADLMSAAIAADSLIFG